MGRRHVAFILESVYGHIVPTLGIAAELIHRGYRVSYAVKRQFEPRILSGGAQAKVYQPLENKLKAFQAMKNEGMGFSSEASASLWKKLQQEETEDTFSKLESLYQPDRPDLIVYDCMNPAGRLLAGKLNIAAVEHSPMVISTNNNSWSYDENLVLVSIPRFFQHNADDLDDRFQFIGFIQNDRKQFFASWRPKASVKKLILVSATTGLLPQTEFFRKAIAAFGDSPWYLVLTIGDGIDPDSLTPLPANCEINRSASNFEILETASLVIGQAGQGSALEALYHAVPQLLIPPSPIHDDCAIRIAELGLGTRLPESEATVENLKTAGISLLEDQATRSRLQEVAKIMRESNGAAMAADLIGKHIVRGQF
jgi:UDP:flavonoid glycosyltransferase YjiC (YdhE family)